MFRNNVLRDENADAPVAAAPAVDNAAPVGADSVDNGGASQQAAPVVDSADKAKQPGETSAEHAKRIAAILKKESALLQRERAMQEKYSEVDRRAKELEERYGKLSETQTQLKEFVIRMRDNPVQFLKEEFGFGPEEYYKYAQNGGEPPPEAKIEREIAALREQLDAERQWRSTFEEELARKTQEYQTQAEARKRQAEEQQQAAATQQSQQEFMGLVRSATDKYPELQYYSDDDILASAAEWVTIRAQQGSIDNLTYDDVAKALHANAVEWHSRLRQQQAAKQEPKKSEVMGGKAAPDAGEEEFERLVKKIAKPTSNAQRTVRTPEHEPYGRTLNGNMTAARSTAKTKPTSLEEERIRLIKELEGMP